LAELHEGATGEIHAIISKTADAYEEASHLSPACNAATYHARFLRELVAQDIFRSKQQNTWEDGHSRCKLRPVRHVIDGAIDEIFPTVIRRDSTLSASQQATQPSVYPQQMLDDAQNTANMHHSSYSYPISPTQSNVAASSQEPMQVETTRSASVQSASAQTYGNSAYVQSPPVAAQAASQPPQPTQSDDLRYWNNMFRDLGFGEAVDQNFPAQNVSSASAPSSHQSLPMGSSHHQSYGNGRGAGPPQQPYAYHHMHSNAPGYGL
jgi:hypothetical protein